MFLLEDLSNSNLSNTTTVNFYRQNPFCTISPFIRRTIQGLSVYLCTQSSAEVLKKKPYRTTKARKK